MTTQIAVLGIGIMGRHMAERLLRAGHGVWAWNRTAAKAEALVSLGAQAAGTPGDAVDGADVAIVMVADGPTSDAVLGCGGANGPDPDGALARLRPGALLLMMSSIPVETARAQAEAVAARGIGYLDAPVSGGEPGARDGTLAIMAGGAAEDFARAQPVFAVFGRATHMGAAGAGSLAKLANQLIVGNTIATVAEALLLLERGGGDPAALADALKGGFADSTVLQNHGRRMVAGDFAPGARSHVQLKDMRTIGALAGDLGLDLPLLKEAAALYEDLVKSGDGDLDHNALYRELKRRNS